MWANNHRFLYICIIMNTFSSDERIELKLESMGKNMLKHANTFYTPKKVILWEVKKSSCIWIQKQFVWGNNRTHTHTHMSRIYTWASIQAPIKYDVRHWIITMETQLGVSFNISIKKIWTPFRCYQSHSYLIKLVRHTQNERVYNSISKISNQYELIVM